MQLRSGLIYGTRAQRFSALEWTTLATRSRRMRKRRVKKPIARTISQTCGLQTPRCGQGGARRRIVRL